MTPDKDRYDPDNPPDELPSETVGYVIGAMYVETADEAAAVDPILGERFEGFTDAFRKDTGLEKVETWLIQVQAAKVRYEDGRPLILSQFVRTIDKKGNPLRAGQAPSQLAQKFREVTGKSASPLAKGDASIVTTIKDGKVPDDAICIRFEETEVTIGRGYSKNFRLFPVAVVSADELAEMEERIIVPRDDSDSSAGETPYNNGAGPAMNPDEAQKLLVEALNGKRPDEMLGVILGTEGLKSVESLLGVSLMEAATDESLAKVLLAKGLMTEDDGVLLAAAS